MYLLNDVIRKNSGTYPYGIQYIEATAPLYILIWSTGFAMIGTVRSIWIVAEGYNKYSKYYILIGAAVNMI